MTARSELTTKAYLEELLTYGSVTHRPYISGHGAILPVYMLKQEKSYMIAAQVSEAFTFMQTPKGFSVMPSSMVSPSYYLDLIYYPTNLDHAEIFSCSRVKENGPQACAPGAVAKLAFHHHSTFKTIYLGYLQHCFRQGSPAELTRSLVSKYLGASYHLLTTFFELDIVHDAQFIRSESPKLNVHGNPLLDRVLQETSQPFRTEPGVLSRI